MTEALTFAPLVPWPVVIFAAVVMLVMVVLAFWRGLTGWWLRAFAALAVLAGLAEPTWRQEDRTYLPDIAFLVIDESASQNIDLRPTQVAEAMAAFEAETPALTAPRGDRPPLEVVTVRAGTAEPGAAPGTRLLTALAKAAAEVSPDRIAGALLITDGQVHDADGLEAFPAPVHVLLTGRADEWDRRLAIETAPAFAIVGEPFEMKLRVAGLGRVPQGDMVPLSISVDGAPPREVRVPVDESVTLELELERGGMNVVQLTVPSAEGELTARNNSAVVSINGIRDRLRVLLVSGEPYSGERTWRNLLKADAAVDLVHFTILRPPEKQDGVPVFELSLIAFPTRELFMDKVDEFDLIIFDRYRRRGVLPSLYLDNIGRYVRDGGALLIASGPAFAGAESLSHTPLADILPAMPTARLIEQGFHPRISEVGGRHPVTRGLAGFAPRPEAEDGTPGWGRWFRLVEMTTRSGHAVMEGPDGLPLLVLDRQGDGRIAMLASDQAWLWSRGYEGGGPQLEMLRRLAHWLMQEPELEEETLVAEPLGETMTVIRRTLGADVGSVQLTGPDGSVAEIEMTEVAPGEWRGEAEVGAHGIYRLAEGGIVRVTAVGPAAPKEFENPISQADALEPLADASDGAIRRLEGQGLPDIRRTRLGGPTSGRSWIGLPRRDAYDVDEIRLTALAPGWLLLALAGLLMVGAWRMEGR